MYCFSLGGPGHVRHDLISDRYNDSALIRNAGSAIRLASALRAFRHQTESQYSIQVQIYQSLLEQDIELTRKT